MKAAVQTNPSCDMTSGTSFQFNTRLIAAVQTKAGARTQFVSPNAAQREKIEDKLWSIHEENTEFVTRAMEAGKRQFVPVAARPKTIVGYGRGNHLG